MIEIAPEKPDGLEHYLPHIAVVKDSSATTKLRIVFDASAKASKNAMSLNDCLYRGPVLMNDLCGILIRARLHPIGILSDVEKAYLQVGLQLEDRDVARFFWLKDPLKGCTEDNSSCYRFTKVLFGVRPSAFLLAGTLAYHIRQSKKPVAAELDGNIYVDNSFVGKPDIQSAIEFYHQAKGFLAEASMNLREWFSNSKELMATIPEVDRGKGDVTQLLGLKWHIQGDLLSSQPRFKDAQKPMTKRKVLIAIASVYDPCGWFSPVTILGRMLMQDLWVRKVGWDMVVPEDLQAVWNENWHNLQGIGEFRLSRCIDVNAARHDSVVEIHTFADASARAYAASAYVCMTSPGKASCNLIFAKCRVSPAKRQVTIPRLELLGVVIGLRLLHFVSKELHLSIARKVIWTDSKCILHWIGSTSVQTKFVENRLTEVRRSLGDVEFRYVPSGDNPADIATRGTDVESLNTNASWWNGPSWLLKSDDHWPPNVELSKQPEVEEALPTAEEIVVPVIVAEKNVSWIDMTKFSDLTHMIRVTAYVLRAQKRFKGHKLESVYVQSSELQQIEKSFVRQVQRESIPGFFHGELTSEMKNLKAQLGLYVDYEGIVRCQGHLDTADMPYEQKHPAFLANDHWFTVLVIRRAHKRVLHMGTGNTLAEMRTQFWVPGDRALVKRVINSCKHCLRMKGGAFQVPEPPPLPAERATQTPPFAVTGLDYIGPLCVSSPKGKGTSKVWIALSKCATIRAVHLEVAESYSASDFLLCFRRFVAAKGAPRLVISDNGKNFLPTSRLFYKAWGKSITSKEIKDFSSDRGIEWKFIPEKSAWMGGFYERLGKPVKDTLVKVLGSRIPPMKELQTLLSEIAAIVNSRPLTYLEKDGRDRPLTPMDFLRVTGSSLSPEAGELLALGRRPTTKELVGQWKQAEKQLDRYWQDWRSKYLVSLRQQYWKHSNRNASNMAPRVGTVVLIKDSLPRARWRMGRITALRMSRDNVCRSVDLVLGNKETIVRPVKSLYPLEYTEEKLSTQKLKDQYESTSSAKEEKSGAGERVTSSD